MVRFLVTHQLPEANIHQTSWREVGGGDRQGKRERGGGGSGDKGLAYTLADLFFVSQVFSRLEIGLKRSKENKLVDWQL
jgi:hypothetical protein